jgi:hypothetical protein
MKNNFLKIKIYYFNILKKNTLKNNNNPTFWKPYNLYTWDDLNQLYLLKLYNFYYFKILCFIFIFDP